MIWPWCRHGVLVRVTCSFPVCFISLAMCMQLCYCFNSWSHLFKEKGGSPADTKNKSDTSECSEALQQLWQVIKSRTGLRLKNSCSPLLPWTWGDLVCHQFCTKWGVFFLVERQSWGQRQTPWHVNLEVPPGGLGPLQFNSGQDIMVMIWVRWWLKQSWILKQQMSQWQL